MKYADVIEVLIAAGAVVEAVTPFPTGNEAIDVLLRRHRSRLDDATIDRVKTSIQVAQDILRRNPGKTLVDFATAYQNWWVQWITDNRGPNAVKWGAPQPDQVGATT